jgi:HEAT repeat protein
MDADAEREVRQLAAADPQERSIALARLVTLGGRATDAILAALPTAGAQVRPSLAQALAEIADPRTAEALAQLSLDPDPQVRGRGAQGLAALHDPRAAEALVRTLGDLPDLLHHPYTVAVYALVALGPSALPHVLTLLQAGDPGMRTQAWLVWRSIVEADPGVRDWNALWQQLGSYAPDAPRAQREVAAQQWEQWLAARRP